MTQEPFSGFMPMISDINITQEMSMINNNGDLVSAHTFTVTSRDGSDFVFSIENADLMKLCFLIMKVLND